MVLFQLIAGLVILAVGAEILVKGASRIAAAIGISPLVIGLTVVAFGTSAPELAVSIMSAVHGKPDMAIGNVIGSNIFNILFLLGSSALFVPLLIKQQLLRLDVPVLIAASFLVLLLGISGQLSVWEGYVFIVLGIIYTVFVIRHSRKETDASVKEEYQESMENSVKPKTSANGISIFLVVIGLVLLVWGSRWMVFGAVEIARVFGISDLVIGITIIAVGTSLPEVATTAIAVIRGERDIAVGNAIGSSIFNIVFILGITAAVGGGLTVPEEALRFDIPVMIASAIACLPLFFTGKKLERWEGFVFLFYYCAYVTYLVLFGQKAPSLDFFTKAMVWFTIPLTILTLGVVTVREYQKRNGLK